MRITLAACFAIVLATVCAAQSKSDPSQVSFVTSRDGTRIAFECLGNGPTLLIVHGGSGDRNRWKPLLPLFAPHFKACAMDRRGHGQSQSGPAYAMTKEIEDVATVVNSLPGPVFVLGHSIGGVFALEAAALTKKIAKLVLYEPPLQERDHTAAANEMEKLIRAGKREQAMEAFLRDVVRVSPAELEKMKAHPAWAARVGGIDVQIREIRTITKYRFDPKRVSKIQTGTLLLKGGKTASPELRKAIDSLMNALPNRELFVFENEGHTAMDTIPQQFAEVVTRFLLGW
jgi:pimeloyl-ACP methyl ester carboxylesterase